MKIGEIDISSPHSIVDRIVYVAMSTVNIDGFESQWMEGIYASKEGAEAALVELRDSPMWERQGLETWVDEERIEP